MTRAEERWLEDCRTHCKRIKYLSEEIEWVEKPNRSSWLMAQASLQDENGITIPGLYFKGEYMPSEKFEKISYALMYLKGQMRCRVFMLEVYPEHILAHREKDKCLFGTHIHLGHEKLGQVTRNVIANISEVLSYKWIDRFRRHARIHDIDGRRLCGPFTDDLFGSQ